MNIKVDAVTLQNGAISFSDFLAKPKFSAEMKKVAGSVTGLSSQANTRAQLHLKGLHGDSAPLDIVGTINPLAAQKFADIDISFKDIELSRFTPYSSKFLGYKIEKGKLVLDLEYLIDGNELKSENRIRFDNFTLGQSVKSEHATSLPVGLAISLLKDSNDQINLDLPVSGQLDDPEFRVGAIVLKMISNLIIKVVASPFSIIGAMFGGGEDLGYIEFKHGQSLLDDSDTQKLDTLARILKDKPSVKLEIQGAFQVKNDSLALRNGAFTDLLKAEKLKLSVNQGETVTELSEIQVDPEEVDGLIDTAYQNAQFAKPRHDDGKEKQLEVDEKRKLLVTHIKISQDDLRLFAMKRSEIIKQYLTESGGIEKERIYLLEPKESEASETDQETKVTFLLK